MEKEVLEGFICPICFKDLKTALNLNSHFQDHSQEDQKILKSLKEIYANCVKKISSKSSDTSSTQVAAESDAQAAASRRLLGYSASLAQDPSSFLWRSHTDRFKAIRDLRNERYAAQTNTLLIRLGKLLLNLPSDPVKRKAYEQEVVSWLDEKDVTLCPGCAKPFHLLKRKHHCRLCGSVMCKYCTFLLSLEDARKMVGSSPDGTTPSAIRNGSPSITTLSKMQPVQAMQAVLSLDAITDSDFRICEHCHRLVAARETARQNRSERPIIAQFYERMRTAMAACDVAVEKYHTIFNSLCNGETKHTLAEASSLRIELLRLADTVDITSKNIMVLGQNTDSPPQGAALKLQQTIRSSAAFYLKKNVVSLPSLPSEEEISQFQERRRLEIERRIEEENRKEREEERRRQLEERDLSRSNVSSSRRPAEVPSGSTKANVNSVYIDEGWTPSVKQAIISDDPLLQQIGILHGFIEQAQRAGKTEECAALQRNLMELEDELDRRQIDGN